MQILVSNGRNPSYKFNYDGRVKSFEPQREDDVTSHDNSGSITVQTLKGTYENFNPPSYVKHC